MESPHCRGKWKVLTVEVNVKVLTVEANIEVPNVGAKPAFKYLTMTTLTDKDLIKNISYIFIINFCYSLYIKLPGKKLIHFHTKIPMYTGIN